MVIAGAILMLEATIPAEFKKIQKGRDINYPDLDDRARLYIDDHIKHDAKSHYPDLMNALKKYVTPEGQIDPRILKGINIMREAKRGFYANLEQELNLK